MSDLQLTSTLERLRAQVAVLREQNEYPAIERCLQMVDMNLHLALWELGEMDEPLPELDRDRSDG
jgi:hypothetical protein